MKGVHLQVVVGTYNKKNLLDLLQKIEKIGVKLGPGKNILTKMIDWPQEKSPKRSEVFPYPTNFPIKCSRGANFFELCTFILRKPEFVCQTGTLEAYDDSFEDFYKETGIDLVVPVFGIYKDNATLYLKPRNSKPEEFKLGAHVMSASK
jgi:hypothetical protein